MSKIEASDIRVQDLDHCGLIAGICDDMGLVEQLDRMLGTHPQEIVTPTSTSQSDFPVPQPDTRNAQYCLLFLRVRWSNL